MITKGSPMAQQDANPTRDHTGSTKRAAENAEEMAGTVTEQAREYGEKARDAVARDFGIATMAASLVEVYAEVAR